MRFANRRGSWLQLDRKSRRELLGDDLLVLDLIDTQLVQGHPAVSLDGDVELHRTGKRAASHQWIRNRDRVHLLDQGREHSALLEERVQAPGLLRERGRA